MCRAQVLRAPFHMGEGERAHSCVMLGQGPEGGEVREQACEDLQYKHSRHGEKSHAKALGLACVWNI